MGADGAGRRNFISPPAQNRRRIGGQEAEPGKAEPPMALGILRINTIPLAKLAPISHGMR
jgi:hypothetical protein